VTTESNRALNLLLVEDSEDDARLLLRELDRAGYRVHWERVDSPQAMEAALRRSRWDLITADYTMPSFSAPDALALLKKTDLDVPFVVISGSIGEEIAVEIMKAGANDYLLKGNLRRLVPAVERELEQAAERRARRQAERQYQLLFENNPEPMWVFDEETLAFLEVNNAACRHYGYSREEFLGMTIREIRPPEDLARLMEALAREPRGPNDSGVWKHRRKDGTIIDVEVVSHPLPFLGRPAQLVLALDVTARRQAERRIQERTTYLNALVENSPLAIVALNPAHRVQLVNPAFVRLFGYEPAELLGRDVDEFIAPPDPDLRAEAAGFAEGLLRGESIQKTTVRRRKDGRTVDVKVYGVPLLNDGRLIGVYGIYEDVSEQRKLEEQLRLAQKMEAIGQLAGGVAHDFNNLLTSILGYSELVAARLQSDPAALEEVEEIKRAGESAAGLTRQLLAFSRRQVLEPKVLELNAIVGSVEKMLRRLIGENIDLVTTLDPSLARVRADAGQIEQVIMNLAINSRDAMPQGGRLTIETANVELDEEYARRDATFRPGRYVMLAVSDTGIGMDAETQSRIFEPFFTTKEMGKGTGLGLSTVYGIVKQTEGWIWVYSEPGRGTTFKIYLPQVEAAADSLDRPVEGASVGGSETVLLVEDAEPLRKLTRIVLERLGYAVLEASNAQDALAMAEAHAGPIHLVLTDVVMPDMGGAALASRLKGLRPAARVLYMSGYTDDAVVRHRVLEPGTRFLQKPFTPTSLARRVREALG